MRSFALLPVLFAGTLSQALPCQQNPLPLPDLWQVTLCATTSIGVCGNPCQPFACEPRFTMASRGEDLRFDIGGTPKQPFALLMGTPVPECQPIAGIDGALAMWAPIVTVDLGIVEYDKAREAMCRSGGAVRMVQIPTTLPAGTDVRFQVLATNTYLVGTKPLIPRPDPMIAGYYYYTTIEQLAFSRPIEVRVR